MTYGPVHLPCPLTRPSRVPSEVEDPQGPLGEGQLPRVRSTDNDESHF